MELQYFHPGDTQYPAALTRWFGDLAPEAIVALGDGGILKHRRTALFCSGRCPGGAILAAYDQASRWRDEERCVISGFHSPVEKECLRILLRGRQAVILCPARGLEGLRVPGEWKKALAEGRLLMLSCFSGKSRRATAALAVRRNEFVAALADEVWFAHIEPGGQMERLAKRVAELAGGMSTGTEAGGPSAGG